MADDLYILIENNAGRVVILALVAVMANIGPLLNMDALKSVLFYVQIHLAEFS